MRGAVTGTMGDGAASKPRLCGVGNPPFSSIVLDGF